MGSEASGSKLLDGSVAVEADEQGVDSTFNPRIRRVEFFAGAGKYALGALGVGGLSSLLAACGGSSNTASGASGGSKGSGGSSGKVQKIAVIEQEFAPFFTENFQKPLAEYLKKDHSSWSETFGNENNTVPTGIKLLEEYVAANDSIVILSTGDEMTAWQHAVEQATSQGSIFINHSTQAVSGATQNVLFSHKEAGINIGEAALAWAKKNNVDAPVVALLGNLSDAQGKKRTEWAWKTIKAGMSNAVLAGQVQSIETATGASSAANLLSANPNINMMICFNTIAGVGAITSCLHAGKTNPSSFFLGCTDSEEQTLKLIATGKSIMQANWGAFFPYSMVLMAKDGIARSEGKSIKPTRLIFGETITTPSQATSFEKISFDPLNPQNAYIYTKYFKYLSTPVGTAEVPPGQ